MVDFAAQDGFLATWAPDGATMPVLDLDGLTTWADLDRRRGQRFPATGAED
ncbi:hypothetical protein [Amycolatopsis sp. lyj-346]|uniref:hypothetical protein n=1 Tax=Amycolatopsis sp. lyj-346 TaxID=2789289 RepID=UPI00397D2F36